MKNHMIVLALCLTGVPLLAQKLDTQTVPASVRASFEKNTGLKDARWEKEDTNYEATFKKGGNQMSMVFDAIGAVLETEVAIKKDELPAAALSVLKKDFQGFKIEEVERVTANGVVTYEVEAEKGEQTFELVFDTQGTLLKKVEEKDTEDKD